MSRSAAARKPTSPVPVVAPRPAVKVPAVLYARVSSRDQEKEGFSIPMKQWLRRELHPMLTSLLSPERVTRRGLFAPAVVQQMVAADLGMSELPEPHDAADALALALCALRDPRLDPRFR